jgi:hypothetical protein
MRAGGRGAMVGEGGSRKRARFCVFEGMNEVGWTSLGRQGVVKGAWDGEIGGEKEGGRWRVRERLRYTRTAGFACELLLLLFVLHARSLASPILTHTHARS